MDEGTGCAGPEGGASVSEEQNGTSETGGRKLIVERACPALSPALRERIEAEYADTDEPHHYERGYCDALRWVLA